MKNTAHRAGTAALSSPKPESMAKDNHQASMFCFRTIFELKESCEKIFEARRTSADWLGMTVSKPQFGQQASWQPL
jgi:hypothetical protein